jgi:2-amino-4-hydroxy-6-hydroxymethyldihydropteridine diphosphokinase
MCNLEAVEIRSAADMVSSSQAPILIGLGGNLPSAAGAPAATLEAAVARLAWAGIVTLRRSRWFVSAPVPPSDQPWFVNGVVAVATALEPGALLAALHGIEALFGRIRGVPNAARTLDLDLLAYGDLVMPPAGAGATGAAGGPILPHPRLAERAFVLLPLADVAPSWHHPVSGRPLAALIDALDPAQTARPLE